MSDRDFMEALDARELDLDTFAEALNRWGFESQARMLQEECAECIVAVNKLDRARGDEENVQRRDELAEEIADVLIMAEQMRLAVGTDLVQRHHKAKMHRLRLRLHEAARRDHERQELPPV